MLHITTSSKLLSACELKRSPLKMPPDVQSTSSTEHLVTRALLDLHDKYDGDLGLLDERWASEEDRVAFSNEQMQTLGEYIDKLHNIEVDNLSPDFRNRLNNRIRELEKAIAPEVIQILRDRMNSELKNKRGEQGVDPNA